MLFGFGYLYVCYIYFFFLQKAGNNRFLKKGGWSKFCNIFLFLHKVGSVGPVDQQINVVLP